MKHRFLILLTVSVALAGTTLAGVNRYNYNAGCSPTNDVFFNSLRLSGNP